MLDFLLLLALLLLSIAIWLQLQPVASRVWLQFKTIQPQLASAPLKSVAAATNPTLKDHKGSLPGHLAVLNHRELLQITGAHRLLPHLSQLSCLSQATFDRDLLPVIERYSEFVQLMPASESHHHANVGGLLVHAMECVHHALVLRRGYVLPRSGGAEIQDEQRDHWTYAVFLGALLHDVGKPLSDLRVSMRLTQAGQATRWMPMSGSLVDCKALEYAVQFAPKAERDYTAHGRMGMVLLQRLVPASTLRFLGQHPNVLEELTQFLGGDTGQGGLAELVSQADQRSTKANLATGDRSRFASARSTPLVEQLMNALQAMLARGGQLPLNRDGAAGWVSQGSVWFVAKRLADEVRQYILAHAGEDAGIPGKDKNDRLFDCWQEYGQILPNPMTQQAIWRVVVHGEDGEGYEHKLSMLRFPLDKLWPNGSHPADMAGWIEALQDDRSLNEAATVQPETASNKVVEGKTDAVGDGELPKTTNHSAQDTDWIPAPKLGDKKKPKSKARKERPALAQDDNLTDAEAENLPAETHAATHQTTQAPTSDLVRVQLHNGGIPLLNITGKAKRAPSETALAFMRWVQTGLSDGSLKYNESGAMVHFVEAGLALVSPAIFKEYLNIHGDETPGENAAGSSKGFAKVQNEVMRANWHRPNPADGSNIWTFQVASSKGGLSNSKLSAVVLAQPKRWIVEPPPPNPSLQLPVSSATTVE